MSANEQRALDFFARWSVSFDEMCASFQDALAPHGVWDQRPFPRFTGPQSSIRFLKASRLAMGLDTIQVDVLKIASVGDTVIAERVDHLRSKRQTLASAGVVGVLAFEDDQIAYWREYFDAASLAAQLPGAAARALLRR